MCEERFFRLLSKCGMQMCFSPRETRLQEHQIELDLEGYHQFWNYAERKGYSGTAVFTKEKPLTVSYGIELDVPDNEGRVITLEFDEFYLVNVYTPNSKRDLTRLDYRLVWEDAMIKHLVNLNRDKPVVFCGDLNVAHNEIDLKNLNRILAILDLLMKKEVK